MKTPQPRTGILDIKPYVPGKAKADGHKVYKLSSNESALGPAPSAITALQDMAADAHRYPDGAAIDLRDKLAALHDLPADQLIIGNGSDEVLTLSVRCFTEPGDHVLMTKHGFSYYPIVAKAEGCDPIMVEEDDLTADVDAILAAVTDRTKLFFLANPNNPTGTLLPHEELVRLRQELPSHIMLVLDGAYAEYVDDADYDSGAGFVRDATESGANNVIMTRTFSKIFGLGGLRVGWGYSSPAVIDVMNRVRGPFNVSASALKAAEAALDDQGFVENNRAHNAEEMARMVQSIRGAGLAVRATRANFILTEFTDEEEAMAFLQVCEEGGVLVRGLKSSNLPHMVRVSIGEREANDAFLDIAMAWAGR
ncbi:MAG: histidinol-phosphate transaminase [Parvularculaceae bacterium]|nr:histidinol-phosphate transaminase [Parvularculaceae bacterium]